MDLLRSRHATTQVPFVTPNDRLIVLPGEHTRVDTLAGRPIGPEYYNLETKLRFMDKHRIWASVISLANPWLDFLSTDEASPMAIDLNQELSEMHLLYPERIYGFGVLPLKNVDKACMEVERISNLPGMRGIIIGTRGIDSQRLDPLWETLVAHKLMVFVHPHYGLGSDEMNGFGHSLLLALGFPFETTLGVTRLILSGVLDRHPELRLLIAHSGGVLPYLAGRLDSCVEGEPDILRKLKKLPSSYLKELYYDSVVYHTSSLRVVEEVTETDSRLMFGTDHPFFPPPSSNSTLWPSVTKNLDALNALPSSNQILYRNAVDILDITPPPFE